jgi:hypothetical protein
MTQQRIKDDIHISIEKISTEIADYGKNYNTVCCVESNTSNVNEFIDECIKYYESSKSDDKFTTYHFIYNGLDSKGELRFVTNVLYTYETETENIDMSICNEHVKYIKSNINKLKNKEYYIKNGLKRKLGYLFYGMPGTGKTVMSSNIALYDRRHIIEVPFSIIKTRDELLMLMNIDKINNISFTKEQIVMLFDEIDIGIQNISRDSAKDVNNAAATKGENNSMNELCQAMMGKEPTKPNSSKIELDTILSQLDGISNYDGIIIIATTNDKEKLDPAIYRELRLTPVEFIQLRKEDVKTIVERFWEQTMLLDSYDKIQNRKHYPSKLIYWCDKYVHEKTIDEFIDILDTL